MTNTSLVQLLVVNNNKYLSYVVNNIVFSASDYPIHITKDFINKVSYPIMFKLYLAVHYILFH